MRNFLFQQQDFSSRTRAEREKATYWGNGRIPPFSLDQCLFSWILLPIDPLQAVTPWKKPCHQGQAEGDEKWHSHCRAHDAAVPSAGMCSQDQPQGSRWSDHRCLSVVDQSSIWPLDSSSPKRMPLCSFDLRKKSGTMNWDCGKHADGANPSSLMAECPQLLDHYGEQ